MRGVHYLRDHLAAEFERTRAAWRDQTAARFQHNYLAPVLSVLDNYVRAQDALVDVIDDAERIVAGNES